jgi:hypothetical protein
MCRIVRAMLTDALKKVNESSPRDANGKKQATVLKYVIVPTGIGLSDDEKLPDGTLNRARVVEKFKNRCLQSVLFLELIFFAEVFAASTRCTVSLRLLARRLCLLL